MKQYQDLVRDVLENGTPSDDRTGTGTLSVFGRQIRFDLSKGFPLVTTKKTYWKGVVIELLWFLRGDTNIKFLQKHGVKIWDSWHDEGMTIGKGYSYQWRNWSKLELLKRKQSKYSVSYAGLDNANVCGVAIGPSYSEDNRNTHIYNVWSEMIHRCYNPKKDHYKWYGGQGVRVCDRWLNYKNFEIDFYEIENGYMKKIDPENYSLDKDYYGSNIYAPDTCIWLSKDEQRINTSRTKLIKITFPSGRTEFVIDVKNFCFRYGLDYSTATKCIRGERKHTQQYCFEPISVPDKLVRLRKFDQIKTVIQQIKNDPSSRRIIVNSWNVGDLDEMALPPCHAFFQFYVRNGKLSCQLYQRSADLFLGVPFNIASYALLTHLIAHETGLQVGDFIHTFGDVHLYNNHLSQAREMISRDPKPLSQLDINPPWHLLTFIDKYAKDASWEKIQEFISLTNYQYHPTIKAPVSV